MADLRRVSAKEAGRIASFIRKVVKDGSAAGAVVGLSGGIDSAVVGALCVRAMGKERVLGLLMPSEHTPSEDVSDARSLARSWGIATEELPISGITRGILGAVKVQGTKIARANVEARVRMVLLYYHANSLGYLVAGTGDRSEELLGFYSKYGDGGVDFQPIAHLYKTQVRELGALLGLPKRVVGKPASPQLWPGQRATDELPADYDKLDVVLHCLYDARSTPAEAADRARVPLSVVKKVIEMHTRTEHKRTLPPSLA